MQNPPGRQAIPVSALLSMPAALHAGVEAAGSSLASASPRPSTATHSPDDAHETPVRPCPSIGVRFHVGAPAVGSVLASASPPPSTATHSPVAEQETASNVPKSILSECQAEAPP